MKFFTDITTNASNLCLLNIKRYYDKRKEQKTLIYVDPGVYELTKDIEYSHFELLHHLASGNLQKNEYISIDYPSDMNLEWENHFVRETIRNNLRYAENEQYICTIQYEFQNFHSFKANFNHLKQIFWNKKKIVGFGNLCRIMKPNAYTDRVFRFLRENMKGLYRIHFYGLALRVIRKYMPLFSLNQLKRITIDSTKWTRACVNRLKKNYGLNCKRSNRDEFFLEYMHLIQKIDRNLIF